MADTVVSLDERKWANWQQQISGADTKIGEDIRDFAFGFMDLCDRYLSGKVSRDFYDKHSERLVAAFAYVRSELEFQARPPWPEGWNDGNQPDGGQ